MMSALSAYQAEARSCRASARNSRCCFTRERSARPTLLSLHPELVLKVFWMLFESEPIAALQLLAVCKSIRKELLASHCLKEVQSASLLEIITLQRWERGANTFVDRLANAGNAGALHFRGLVRVNCSDEGDDKAVLSGLVDLGEAAALRYPPAIFSLLETVQFTAPERWEGAAAEALRSASALARRNAHVLEDRAVAAAARVSPANALLVEWNACHVQRVQRWKRLDGPGVLLRLPYLNHCSMGDCGRRCVKGSGFCAQLNFCAECRLQPYCSKSCQTAHWQVGHRRFCRQLQVVAMAAHAHAHAVLAAQILGGAPGAAAAVHAGANAGPAGVGPAAVAVGES